MACTDPRMASPGPGLIRHISSITDQHRPFMLFHLPGMSAQFTPSGTCKRWPWSHSYNTGGRKCRTQQWQKGCSSPCLSVVCRPSTESRNDSQILTYPLLAFEHTRQHISKLSPHVAMRWGSSWGHLDGGDSGQAGCRVLHKQLQPQLHRRRKSNRVSYCNLDDLVATCPCLPQ
jgi:hypothetical protein